MNKVRLMHYSMALVLGLGLAGCASTSEATKHETADQPMSAEQSQEPTESAQAAAESDDSTQTAEAAPAEQPEAKSEEQTHQPAFTGKIEGAIGGAGITNGKIRLTVRDDGTVAGFARGSREDHNFIVPLQGKVSGSGESFEASGKRRANALSATGTLAEDGINGQLSGKIFDAPIKVSFTLKK